MLVLIAVLLVAGALAGAGGPRSLGRTLARGLRRSVPGPWRPGAGSLALAAILLALVSGVRGEWPLAAGAAAVGGGLLLVTRRRSASKPPAAAPEPSRREAADLLGVPHDASEGQIRAAHARLIKMAHPDRGGTAALAAHLNAARDTLLAARARSTP